MSNPALQLFEKSVDQFLNPGFRIETLAGDCKFTEGPVWNEEGFYLFSDITANCIYRIQPGKKKEIFIENSGIDDPSDPDLKPDQVGSNGLAYDGSGNLLVCQHGSHRVSRYNNQRLEPLISRYNGKPFNSPNDIIVHKSGKIYFSDPPYGLKDGVLNSDRYQPTGAVFCWEGGKTSMVCDSYQYPNGVCLSPDGSKLYISSNKPFEKFISILETATDRLLGIAAEENSDGIKCDTLGNLWLANQDGILVLDPAGKRLALIRLPSVPANLCWGGPKKKDLFVTARESVFLIRGLQR
jgi:gluconolactonase